MGENWYDNEPNENAIWFIQIFAQVDKAGTVKIYAAYKVTFEGDDARVDSQRSNPKIKNIEFIVRQRIHRPVFDKRSQFAPSCGGNFGRNMIQEHGVNKDRIASGL